MSIPFPKPIQLDGYKMIQRPCLLRAFAAVVLLKAGFLTTATAGVMVDNTISTEIVNNFFGVPDGVIDTLFTQTGATYGERFAGQTLSASGSFDALSGTPTSPLTLLPGESTRNLMIIGGDLAGCGPQPFSSGCPAASSVGEGAISVLLDEQSDVFGISVAGGNAGPLTLDFFSIQGVLVESLNVVAFSGFQGFRATEGDLIAGVSITNRDFGGIFFNFLSFNQTEPPPAPVPLPTTLSLCTLGLLGLRLARGCRVKTSKCDSL
jgi:hypothetical protein